MENPHSDALVFFQIGPTTAQRYCRYRPEIEPYRNRFEELAGRVIECN
jgi:hypothetical protein